MFLPFFCSDDNPDKVGSGADSDTESMLSSVSGFSKASQRKKR